ncbi:tetratricopeptide repeat-containing sensor histidine kinase [Flavitalea antarctica]
MKIVYLVLLSLTLHSDIRSQVPQEIARSTTKSITDKPATQNGTGRFETKTIYALLDSANRLGSRFDPRHPEHKRAIDYLDKAIRLSAIKKLSKEEYQAGISKLEIYYVTGLVGEMELMLQKSSDSLKAEVARNISRYYNDNVHTHKQPNKAIEYANLSLKVSQAIKDVQRQINANNQIGYVYSQNGRLREAEDSYLESVRLSGTGRYEHVAQMYAFLARIASWRGNINRGIRYLMQALQYLGNEDDYAKPTIYILLGKYYYDLNDYEKSLAYLAIARPMVLKQPNKDLRYSLAAASARPLLKQGKPTEAKALWEESLAGNPPVTPWMKFKMNLSIGIINTALGEYELAKSSLATSLALSNNASDSAEIEQAFAELYFSMGDFQKCKSYLSEIFNKDMPSSAQATAHLLAFRADSALRNFEAAMVNLHKGKILSDSINAVERRNELEDYRIQNETERFRQNVLLKDREISILETQKQLQERAFTTNRLNFLLEGKQKENHLLRLKAETFEKDKSLLQQQRNIDNLRNDNLKRESNLARANSIKNFTLAFVILLLALVILLYKQYRSKQLANAIIRSKNDALEKLVHEKEWLLKEVHHRVKNNLQTVVSLLESQAVYLTNEALEANQNSKNRVYAMSLVHQKLYMTENMTSIQADNYLQELINYLKDSMVVNNISFKVRLCNLQLEVSQAIALGLILNEALTNIIKYAFPLRRNDAVVNIMLSKISNDEVQLVIEDNGIGFSTNAYANQQPSLGLTLMKGLSQDLTGTIKIESGNGTKISLRFSPKEPHVSVDKLPGTLSQAQAQLVRRSEVELTDHL